MKPTKPVKPKKPKSAAQRCWHMMAYPERQCPKPGVYGTPYFVGYDGKRSTFVEQSRWCKKHKFKSDRFLRGGDPPERGGGNENS